MTKDQWALFVVLLSLLAGSIQQFYSLKTEVETLRIKMEYIYGTGWDVPKRADVPR